MLDNRAEAVLTSHAGAMGTVAAKVAISVYEDFVGNAYSKEDQNRLAELKRVYLDILKIKPPVFWDLDDKKRPTLCVNSQRWSEHVHQMNQGKSTSSHFYYQSSLIADYAASYLNERGKRYVGNGHQGDLLEQFMGEWIHFALNDLPTLQFDEISIEKINQRIKYLEKVQNHTSLFRFGRVTRLRNKFDTMENIKRQLKFCIALARQEVTRQCARDKFSNFRTDLANLLCSAVRMIYYTRVTPVAHEPLELNRYIQKNLTNAVEKLYPSLQLTHSGAMLKDVITLSGLESFGALGQAKTIYSEYFDENFSPRPLKLKDKKFDLPPWVCGETESQASLVEFQLMAESILRVAQLKQLLEMAYDLTGRMGDTWAYGDKQGQMSLEALLFLFEKELALLKERVNQCHDHHEKARQSYNLVNRVNSNSGVNPNFIKVNERKEDFDKFLSATCQMIKDIRDQMLKFPKDESDGLSEKKRLFYRLVMHYLRQFHPNHCLQFQELECEFIEESTKLKSDPQKVIEYFQVDITTLQSDEGFREWMLRHITAHHNDYIILCKLAYVLKKQLAHHGNYSGMQAALKSFQDHIVLLKEKANQTRPSWRLQWRAWPFKSVGWPFGRETQHHLDTLMRHFELLSKNADVSVERVKQKMMNTAMHNMYRLLPPRLTNTLNPGVEMSEVGHYSSANMRLITASEKKTDNNAETDTAVSSLRIRGFDA